MSNILAVLLDGVAQLEYNRDQQLPPHQALYLEKNGYANGRWYPGWRVNDYQS